MCNLFKLDWPWVPATWTITQANKRLVAPVLCPKQYDFPNTNGKMRKCFKEIE